MTVGVFALQGSFKEHLDMLKKMNVNAHEVRSLKDVEDVDAVILPGGESTTLMKLLKKTGLDEWLQNTEAPIYGTCAGMIALSNGYLNLIDVDVERNAYGTQQDSFEDTIMFYKKPFPGIFIRAPKFAKIGDEVEVLAKHIDEPVLAKQGRVMVGTFHPELTGETAIHEFFLSLA